MFPIGFRRNWKAGNLSKLLDLKCIRIQPSRNERLMTMFSMQYLHGHVMVYDKNGNFLFSADSEWEAREELEEYEESAA